MSEPRPVHLVAAGATRTLCDIRVRDPRSTPFMAPDAVERRHASYVAHGLDPERICPACEARR